MWRTTSTALVLAALVAGGLAGCGKSDEDEAQDAVQTYLTAFGDGDGEKACELLTEKVRDAFVAQVRGLVDTEDCGKAFDTIQKGLTPAQTKAVSGVRVAGAKIDGDRGTVNVRSGGTTVATRVEKVDGDWRIAQPPGQ